MSDQGRILLAEDNLNDIELIKTAFQEARIINELDVVRDGEEALDFLYFREAYEKRERYSPVAVLLDLKMPKVGGLEVLETIKKDPILRLIPCVIMTSSREEKDLYSSYDKGANAYVVKPIDFRQFSKAVKELGMFWAVLNQPPTIRQGKA